MSGLLSYRMQFQCAWGYLRGDPKRCPPFLCETLDDRPGICRAPQVGRNIFVLGPFADFLTGAWAYPGTVIYAITSPPSGKWSISSGGCTSRQGQLSFVCRYFPHLAGIGDSWGHTHGARDTLSRREQRPRQAYSIRHGGAIGLPSWEPLYNSGPQLEVCESSFSSSGSC